MTARMHFLAILGPWLVAAVALTLAVIRPGSAREDPSVTAGAERAEVVARLEARVSALEALLAGSRESPGSSATPQPPRGGSLLDLQMRARDAASAPDRSRTPEP